MEPTQRTSHYQFDPVHYFGPPRPSSYTDSSFEPYPSEPEAMPVHLEPPHTEQTRNMSTKMSEVKDQNNRRQRKSLLHSLVGSSLSVRP